VLDTLTMPARKARPTVTCCDLVPTCSLADSDVLCAPAVLDACPDCGMTVDDHEGCRLGYPWCMATMLASKLERLISRGTWAYCYDYIIYDGEVKFKSRFWRDACHTGKGHAHGLPRIREFIGQAACAPTREQVVIDPVDGMRLVVDATPPAPRVLSRLSFAALRAAHRRAFGGRRWKRCVANLSEYNARAWREALEAQARPLSAKQLAALLGVYSHACVDVAPFERLSWRADRGPWEAAVRAAHARRKPYRDMVWSVLAQRSGDGRAAACRPPADADDGFRRMVRPHVSRADLRGATIDGPPHVLG